ncbi:MAG: hypothetical protein KBA40_04215 [Candidatus Peribacteraceae bacterium]|nr:hypothetical protein [Candidatus Peribacteraceae bacterium]MBP9850884.1 hypothetical protein [Candidatus Peribacteraceae bacterium]
MTSLKHHWPLVALALTLVLVVLLNIRPYGSNVTSIFHIDKVLHDQNPMPKGFVILGVPSYDGAQYYQIARNMPKILSPSRWHELRNISPGSYAYQRFLLPLTAFVLSLGQEAALPYAFLFINIFALLLTAAAILRKDKHPIYALALCLSPAAIVAMHFTLAEPLTILLITIVLLRYSEKKNIAVLDIALLSLLVLAREVNILFIAYLLGFSILTRNWRDALKLLIPATVFVAWHAVIFGIFDNIPFLISAEAKVFPFSEPIKNMLGVYGYDQFSLSAIALFLGFVLPGLIWICRDILTTKKLEALSLGALAFFGVMLLMPHYIWGSITSIGRVITPVYPLYILALANRDTRLTRVLALLILLIGLGAAAGLARSVHPYSIAP